MKPMIRTLTAGAIAAVFLAFGPMLAEAQRWGGNSGAGHFGAVPDPIIPADGTQNITGGLAVSGAIAVGGASDGTITGGGRLILNNAGSQTILQVGGTGVATVNSTDFSLAKPLIVTGSTDVTQLKVISNATQTTVPFQIFASNGTTNIASLDINSAWNLGSSLATLQMAGANVLDRRGGSATGLRLTGGDTDGASAVALAINNSNTLSNAAAKLVSVLNNGVEKAYVLFDGTIAAKNLRAFASGGLLVQDSSGTTIANFADSSTTMVIGRAAADQTVQFPGGINVGNSGSTVLNHTRVTVALDFPSHGPVNQSALTTTWGGPIALKTTDSCRVTTNFGSQNAVNQCYVSTAGGAGVGVITVLEYCMNGAAGTCDTLSKNYYLDVDVY